MNMRPPVTAAFFRGARNGLLLCTLVPLLIVLFLVRVVGGAR